VSLSSAVLAFYRLNGMIAIVADLGLVLVGIGGLRHLVRNRRETDSVDAGNEDAGTEDGDEG